MKDFVKTMLAVICGYFVLRIIGFLFLLFFLVGSLAGSTPSLPKNGVLDLDMSTILFEEQSKDSSTPSMMSMSFDMTPVVGLHDAVEAIHFAASDPGVKYILLRADAAVIGMAGAEELRASLAAFRDSGKPVVAYVENPSNGSFFLSSVADKIYMGVHHGGKPRGKRKPDPKPSRGLLGVEKHAIPEIDLQQHEKQSRRIRPCQLAVKDSELANSKESRRKQSHSSVEPLPPYDINKVYRANSHQCERQLDPEGIPTNDFDPVIKENLHACRMGIGSDTVANQVKEAIVMEAREGAELVVHERHLAQLP